MTHPTESASTWPEPPQTAFIPKQRYLSEEFAAAELAKLWCRVWLHAAPAEQLSSPGQFVTVEVGGANVLVIRGRDGVVRAFHNVCMHRGRRLVDAPCGQVKALRCPLHHWTYGSEGKLEHVPDREVFGELVHDDLGLRPLACESWGGQVWVHLGKPRQTLREWLEPAVSRLEHYELDNYAFSHQSTFDLPCNWKLAADQFNEAYHLRSTHPELLGMVDDRVTIAFHGPHVLQTFAIARASSHVSPTQVTDALVELLRSNGANATALDGDASKAPELLRSALRARGIKRLSDEELLLGQSWFFFPALTFTVYAHSILFHRYRPHSRDPARCWVDQFIFTRLGPGEERPKPEISLMAEVGRNAGGPVFEADARELLALQPGLRSPGFEGMRLGAHERCAIHMHAMIDRWLAEPSTSSANDHDAAD